MNSGVSASTFDNPPSIGFGANPSFMPPPEDYKFTYNPSLSTRTEQKHQKLPSPQMHAARPRMPANGPAPAPVALWGPPLSPIPEPGPSRPGSGETGLHTGTGGGSPLTPAGGPSTSSSSMLLGDYPVTPTTPGTLQSLSPSVGSMFESSASSIFDDDPFAEYNDLFSGFANIPLNQLSLLGTSINVGGSALDSAFPPPPHTDLLPLNTPSSTTSNYSVPFFPLPTPPPNLTPANPLASPFASHAAPHPHPHGPPSNPMFSRYSPAPPSAAASGGLELNLSSPHGPAIVPFPLSPAISQSSYPGSAFSPAAAGAGDGEAGESLVRVDFNMPFRESLDYMDFLSLPSNSEDAKTRQRAREFICTCLSNVVQAQLSLHITQDSWKYYNRLPWYFHKKSNANLYFVTANGPTQMAFEAAWKSAWFLDVIGDALPLLTETDVKYPVLAVKKTTELCKAIRDTLQSQGLHTVLEHTEGQPTPSLLLPMFCADAGFKAFRAPLAFIVFKGRKRGADRPAKRRIDVTETQRGHKRQTPSSRPGGNSNTSSSSGSFGAAFPSVGSTRPGPGGYRAADSSGPGGSADRQTDAAEQKLSVNQPVRSPFKGHWEQINVALPYYQPEGERPTLELRYVCAGYQADGKKLRRETLRDQTASFSLHVHHRTSGWRQIAPTRVDRFSGKDGAAVFWELQFELTEAQQIDITSPTCYSKLHPAYCAFRLMHLVDGAWERMLVKCHNLPDTEERGFYLVHPESLSAFSANAFVPSRRVGSASDVSSIVSAFPEADQPFAAFALQGMVRANPQVEDLTVLSPAQAHAIVAGLLPRVKAQLQGAPAPSAAPPAARPPAPTAPVPPSPVEPTRPVPPTPDKVPRRPSPPVAEPAKPTVLEEPSKPIVSGPSKLLKGLAERGVDMSSFYGGGTAETVEATAFVRHRAAPPAPAMTASEVIDSKPPGPLLLSPSQEKEKQMPPRPYSPPMDPRRPPRLDSPPLGPMPVGINEAKYPTLPETPNVPLDDESSPSSSDKSSHVSADREFSREDHEEVHRIHRRMTDAYNPDTEQQDLDTILSRFQGLKSFQGIRRLRSVLTVLLDNRLLDAKWMSSAESTHKLRVLQVVRLLTRDYEFLKLVVRAVVPLVRQLRHSAAESQQNPDTAYVNDIFINICGILSRLARFQEMRDLLFDLRVHHHLIWLLWNRHSQVRQAVLSVLHHLAASERFLRTVTDMAAVDPLLLILRDESPACRPMAALLLKNLLELPTCLEQAKMQNAGHLLKDLLTHPDDALRGPVLGCLVAICKDKASCRELVASGLIDSLLSLLRLPKGVSAEVARNTCTLLGELCCENEWSLEIRRSDGVYLIGQLLCKDAGPNATTETVSVQLHAMRALKFLHRFERNRKLFPRLFTAEIYDEFVSLPETQRSLSAYESCVRKLNQLSFRDVSQIILALQALHGAPTGQRKVRDYVIQEVLGKGSFGTVYQVQKEGSPALYAMKELEIKNGVIGNDDEKFEKRANECRDEVLILSRLEHPNIVKLHTSFIEGDRFYIVMELVEGVSLVEHIRSFEQNGKKMEEENLWHIFMQMLAALSYLHLEKNVVHRDLHPGNVMIDKKLRVKIMDFGLARERNNNSKSMRTMVGTIFYSCPEMLKGARYDNKADIWALGCLLYQMATLKPPFFGNEYAAISRIVDRQYEPIPPNRYSPLLYNVVTKLLSAREERPDIIQVSRLVSPLLVVELDKINASLLRVETELRRERDRHERDSYELVRYKKFYQHFMAARAAGHEDSLRNITLEPGPTVLKRERTGPGYINQPSDRRAELPVSAPGPDYIRQLHIPEQEAVTQMLHKIMFLSDLPQPLERDPRRQIFNRYRRTLFSGGSSSSVNLVQEAKALVAGDHEPVHIEGHDEVLTHEQLRSIFESLLLENGYYQQPPPRTGSKPDNILDPTPPPAPATPDVARRPPRRTISETSLTGPPRGPDTPSAARDPANDPSYERRALALQSQVGYPSTRD